MFDSYGSGPQPQLSRPYPEVRKMDFTGNGAYFTSLVTQILSPAHLFRGGKGNLYPRKNGPLDSWVVCHWLGQNIKGVPLAYSREIGARGRKES